MIIYDHIFRPTSLSPPPLPSPPPQVRVFTLNNKTRSLTYCIPAPRIFNMFAFTLALQTCLLCHTADMSVVSRSQHVCCVTQQTCHVSHTRHVPQHPQIKVHVQMEVLKRTNGKMPYIYEGICLLFSHVQLKKRHSSPRA